jgi:hypothetical protein
VAHLRIEDDELVLALSSLEQVEGLHGPIRVPVSSVREVRSVDDAWAELRGLRAPGTGIPGVIAVGTRRGSGIKDFAVVHGRGPAVVVELEGAGYDRLVVSDGEAEADAAELRRQIGVT